MRFVENRSNIKFKVPKVRMSHMCLEKKSSSYNGNNKKS